MRHPNGDANGRERRQPSPTEPSLTRRPEYFRDERGVPQEHGTAVFGISNRKVCKPFNAGRQFPIGYELRSVMSTGVA